MDVLTEKLVDVKEEVIEKTKSMMQGEVMDMFDEEEDEKSSRESDDEKEEHTKIHYTLPSLVFIGGAFLGLMSGFNYVQSIYFTIITMTT